MGGSCLRPLVALCPSRLSRLLAFGTGRGHIRVALIPQWMDLSVAAPGYQCRKKAWRLLNWSVWERKGVVYRLQGTRWKPRDSCWEVHRPPKCQMPGGICRCHSLVLTLFGCFPWGPASNSLHCQRIFAGKLNIFIRQH